MPRIVYVEDNDDNVFMLQTRLELTEGYEVLIAVNGKDGLALIAKERPDLVLMDLNLPDIDGWEVTRRLKADPATATIPVIALTAHAMAGDREKALATGCDEFDTKPIDFGRLLQKMDALLGG
jgi:two-component system, cell cycle response regulator DivK